MILNRLCVLTLIIRVKRKIYYLNLIFNYNNIFLNLYILAFLICFLFQYNFFPLHFQHLIFFIFLYFESFILFLVFNITYFSFNFLAPDITTTEGMSDVPVSQNRFMFSFFLRLVYSPPSLAEANTSLLFCSDDSLSLASRVFFS